MSLLVFVRPNPLLRRHGPAAAFDELPANRNGIGPRHSACRTPIPIPVTAVRQPDDTRLKPSLGNDHDVAGHQCNVG